MSLNDLKLGRLIRTNRTTFISNNGSTVTINPNKDRVFIAAGIDIQGTGQAFRLQVKVDGLIFTSLNNNVTSFLCDSRRYGELPTMLWEFLSVGTTFQGAIIEGFLPESVLKSHLPIY